MVNKKARSEDAPDWLQSDLEGQTFFRFRVDFFFVAAFSNFQLILPSTISVRAMSAALNPAVSKINGRFPPAFNWRTRIDTKLMST